MGNVKHRERLEICLSGGKPDRVPAALWRHFPVDDQNPESLAAAAVNFQRTFDFDLVKYTPASSFCIKDWGSQDEWRGDPEGTRDYINKVIQEYGKLKPTIKNRSKIYAVSAFKIKMSLL